MVLHLILDRGHSPEKVRDMLYERAGLLGVSGISGEMNDLLASDRAEAAEAVNFFVYQCRRTFGSLAAAMGGVDGVVLTGGHGRTHLRTARAACRRAGLAGGRAGRGHQQDRRVGSDGPR